MTPKPYTDRDLAEVSDNPEWTTDDFHEAKPFSELFPDLAAGVRRARGAQKAPTKKLVSLRLSQEVIERFKADGPGWQTRIDETLRRAVGLK